MNKQRKARRTQINATLRNAKRAGKRVYPAYNDADAITLRESLGNGNGYIRAANNPDNI